jgi:hypothetical protein
MDKNLTNVGGDFNFYYAPHCCKCSVTFCDHTGGPYYCTIHDPNYISPATWITYSTSPDPDLHGKLDKIIKLLEKLVK